MNNSLQSENPPQSAGTRSELWESFPPAPACQLPPFATRVGNLTAEFQTRYGREPEYLVLGKEEYLLFTYFATMNKHVYTGHGGINMMGRMEVLRSAHNNKLAVV